MKTFCPNCENDTESEFLCEVHSCNDCGEDCGNYEKPVARMLGSVISLLMKNSVSLASELKLEQNKGYKCYALQHHNNLINAILEDFENNKDLKYYIKDYYESAKIK